MPALCSLSQGKRIRRIAGKAKAKAEGERTHITKSGETPLLIEKLTPDKRRTLRSFSVAQEIYDADHAVFAVTSLVPKP